MVKNYKKLKVRALWCISVLFCLLFTVPVNGQTVTVNGTNSGSLSVMGSTKYFATWRHVQAPLSIITSNGTDFGNVASNLHIAEKEAATKGKLECYNWGTHYKNCYIKMTLPVGYRFTDYHITMQRKGEAAYTEGGQLYFYETGSDFSTESPIKKVDLGSSNSSTGTFSINRQSTEMGNVIYFVYTVEKGMSVTAGITFTSFSVSFAADVDFNTTLAPAKAFTTAQDSVWSKFDTGKLDYGVFNNESSTSDKNYGYVGTDTKPRYAYNTLYQSDCYATAGTYATPTTKTIIGVTSDSKNYYGLGNNTYFAEVATSALTRGAGGDNTNIIPVGYRITGAKINYNTPVKETTDGYTIISNGYYLMCSSTGKLSWASTSTTTAVNATRWYGEALAPYISGKAEPFGHIYCKFGNDNYYLDKGYSFGSGYQIVTLKNSTGGATFYNLNNKIYIDHEGDATQRYFIQYDSSTNTVKTNSVTESDGPTEAAEPFAYITTTSVLNDPYTLTVYNNNGDVETAIQVSANGTYELVTGRNNDAIKFAVSDLNSGNYALVTVDLILQPLDPYVSSMSVGYAPEGNPAVAQEVTTSDFDFGDNVQLILPTAYKTEGDSYNLTFSNLKSKYSDDTYYNNTTSTDKSRYYFVKSEYYTNYQSDLTEVASHDYADKVLTTKVGNKPFTFSNVEKLAPTVRDNIKRYYEEYEFSENNYDSKDNGSFNVATLAVGGTGTYYIFVGDETRYNIAPSKDLHRYYAYYKVTVNLSMVSQTPVLTWTPIYQSSLYDDNGTDQNNYYAGLKVTAKNTETGEAVTKGYLLASDIITQMNKDIADKVNNAPINSAHVLYIDNSELTSVVTTASTDGDDLSDLQSSLAKNALLFLPAGSTTTFNNAVAKTASSYKALSNIVLTDKQPFFTPYAFTVGGDNYATYTRQLTWTNGQVSNATMMLPFSLSLTSGQHTNTDGKCSFTVYKMNATDCLVATETGVGTNYSGTAKFTAVSADKTEANEPYYVKVDKYEGTESSSSFIATENGAEFVATPASSAIASKSTSTGKVNGSDLTFTNKATFCGQTIPKGEVNIFYFGKNKFYNITNLSKDNLYVYPFRAYYSSGTAGAKMNMFDVEFDDDETTGIDNVNNNQNGFKVRSSQGNIVISTSETTPVKVYSMTGQCLNKVTVEAGQNKFIPVSAGVYLVNGVKVAVK